MAPEKQNNTIEVPATEERRVAQIRRKIELSADKRAGYSVGFLKSIGKTPQDFAKELAQSYLKMSINVSDSVAFALGIFELQQKLGMTLAQVVEGCDGRLGPITYKNFLDSNNAAIHKEKVSDAHSRLTDLRSVLPQTPSPLAQENHEVSSEEPFVKGQDDFGNPVVLRVGAMKAFESAKKIAAQKNLKLWVSSSHRTYAEQQDLKNLKHNIEVATPGHSAHHTGGALDIAVWKEEWEKNPAQGPNSKTINLARAQSMVPVRDQIMKAAGFVNYSPEPWHWEINTERWKKEMHTSSPTYKTNLNVPDVQSDFTVTEMPNAPTSPSDSMRGAEHREGDVEVKFERKEFVDAVTGYKVVVLLPEGADGSTEILFNGQNIPINESFRIMQTQSRLQEKWKKGDRSSYAVIEGKDSGALPDKYKNLSKPNALTSILNGVDITAGVTSPKRNVELTGWSRGGTDALARVLCSGDPALSRVSKVDNYDGVYSQSAIKAMADFARNNKECSVNLAFQNVEGSATAQYGRAFMKMTQGLTNVDVRPTQELTHGGIAREFSRIFFKLAPTKELNEKQLGIA